MTAYEYLGQRDGQESAAVWAAVAQIHAKLVLAAATALGRTAAQGRARADVAGTTFSAGGPWATRRLPDGTGPIVTYCLIRHRG